MMTDAPNLLLKYIKVKKICQKNMKTKPSMPLPPVMCNMVSVSTVSKIAVGILYLLRKISKIYLRKKVSSKNG